MVAALDNPENAKKVFEKLREMGVKYKGYIKWSGGIGAGLGSTFAGAHMLDVADDRKLSRKEMVAYPIIGSIGGAFIGVTSPVWVIFAPVGYVFGYDNVAALAKALLAGAILSDD